MKDTHQDCLHRFDQDISEIALPEKFNFPFYYEPHALTRLAARQLQRELLEDPELDHNFGLDTDQSGLIIGKMFGVLVVRDARGQIGYLAAVSGKLAGRNDIKGLVPPVYDMLTDEGFFRKEEIVINEMTLTLEALESDPNYLSLKEKYEAVNLESQETLASLRNIFNRERRTRKKYRADAVLTMTEAAYAELHQEHKKISLAQQHNIKQQTHDYGQRLQELGEKVAVYQDQIQKAREERKAKSRALQARLFNQYQFLNIRGETKTLLDIFTDGKGETPPAGAGECAAPKLLNYAFQHGLEPICMGEFWWGQPPKSEIRKHQSYYPACRGKCEPILSHMLIGLEMDENPMLSGPDSDKQIRIIYEDEAITVIHKPHEFLSVPGKSVEDSVYFRMKQRYPDTQSPLIVHRLDMSTSGIMLIAKTKTAHKNLQKQFLKKKVQKQYIAILEGQVEGESGEINLPLRVDLDDRPRQLVCEAHGKSAETHWEVISRDDQKTRVRFYPITGRTHQLRVHSAHHMGLGIPIIGDDIYGNRAERLYLHAAYIELDHPVSRERVGYSCDPDF